jgi:hypothetical protein
MNSTRLIASLVGGIIIFLWQFLSWAALNLHKPAQQYTANQEAILSALAANLPAEGGYMVPAIPENSSTEEAQRLMQQSVGKPWAMIQYHKSMEDGMGMNIARNLIIDIVMVWLFTLIITKLHLPSFSTIFISSVIIGLIVFFNSPYTISIWYKSFDVWAHFADAMVSWGLCGAWLGWYLNRKQ